MGYLHGTWILVERNFKSKWRNVIPTLFEFLMPIVVLIFMMVIRSSMGKPVTSDDVSYSDAKYADCLFGQYGRSVKGLWSNSTIIPGQIQTCLQFSFRMWQAHLPERYHTNRTLHLLKEFDYYPLFTKRILSESHLFYMADQFVPRVNNLKGNVDLLISSENDSDVADTFVDYLNTFFEQSAPQSFGLTSRCRVSDNPDCDGYLSRSPESSYYVNYPPKASAVDYDDPRLTTTDAGADPVVGIQIDDQRYSIRMYPVENENFSIVTPLTYLLTSVYDDRKLQHNSKFSAQFTGINPAGSQISSFLDYQLLINKFLHDPDISANITADQSAFIRRLVELMRQHPADWAQSAFLYSLPKNQTYFQVPEFDTTQLATALSYACAVCHTAVPYDGFGTNEQRLCNSTYKTLATYSYDPDNATRVWNELLTNVSNPDSSLPERTEICQNLNKVLFPYVLQNDSSTDFAFFILVIDSQIKYLMTLEKPFKSLFASDLVFEAAMPTPASTTDNFSSGTLRSGVWGEVWVMVFIVPVGMALRNMMSDKTHKLREMLNLYGGRDSQYWLSWYIFYGIYFAFLSLLCSITALYLNYKTSFISTYLLNFWFAMSGLSWSLLMTSAMSNERTAGFVGAVLFFFLYSFYVLVFQLPYNYQTIKLLSMLASPAALGWGTDIILAFGMESTGSNIGLQPSDWSTPFRGVKYTWVVGFLILDTFLYLIVGLYIFAVNPGPHGVPRHPLFFITMPIKKCLSLCCPAERQHEVQEPVRKNDGRYNFRFEPDLRATMEEPIILAKNVHKVYSRGAGTFGRLTWGIVDWLKSRRFVSAEESLDSRTGLHAVKGISLRAYKNEIFCLLGHNGAGKSTFISMLTGLSRITYGEAYVCGINIMKDYRAAKKKIGLCPQHDALFERLTVHEHLILVGVMKGLLPRDAADEATKLVGMLELTPKAHVMSMQLSGGQKRRVTLGMALMGNAEALFLDEPSTGLDPATRRELWMTLKGLKESRAIILTTHYMDEADFLGDRIAIMAKGQLQCCGSSMFLKKVMGVGYTLNCTKAKGCTPAQTETLKNEVMSMFEGSRVRSETGMEIAFGIPFSNTSLADLIEKFETNLSRYGIEQVPTPSITTLEEVFLSLTGDELLGKTDSVDHDEYANTDDGGDEGDSLPGEVENPLAARKTTIVAETDIVVQLTHAGDTGRVDQQNSRDGSASQDLLIQASTEPEHGSAVLSNLATLSEHSDPEVLSSMDEDHGRDERGSSKDIFARAKEHEHRRTCIRLVTRQGRALIRKEWLNLRRDGMLLCWTLVIPIVVFAVLSALVNGALPSKASTIEMTIEGALASEPSDVYRPQEILIGGLDVDDLYNSFSSCSMVKSGTAFVRKFPAKSPKAFEEHLVKTMESVTPRYMAYYKGSSAGNGSRTPVYLYHNDTFYSNSPELAVQLLLSCSLLDTEVTLVNEPLPRVPSWMSIARTAFSVMWLGLSLSIIPAAWGSQVGMEQQCGAKFAQFLAGVTIVLYWLAYFIFHFVFFWIPALFISLLLYVFKSSVVDSRVLYYYMVSLAAYAVACGPFSYALTFVMEGRPMMIQIVVSFLGMLMSGLIAMLRVLRSYKYWKYLLFFIPQGSFAESVCIIGYDAPLHGYDFDVWSTLRIPVAFQLALCPFYLIVCAVWDYLKLHRPLQRCRLRRRKVKEYSAECLDTDVVEERSRIQKQMEEGVEITSPLVIMGLTKVFTQKHKCSSKDPTVKVSVRDLWFEVLPGECFGFLGVNGAGKTTTVSMLFTLLVPTFGDALIGGHPLSSEPKKVRRVVGNCPQFDTHFGKMTGKEHLEFYGRVNLMRESYLQHEFIPQVVQLLGIKEFQNVWTERYSGGNKRKLSVGLAFLGDPRLVILDEPSAGVDPVSRRKFWNLISFSTRASNRAILLTTHSMEECEALCDRLGVMKDGELVCIGSKGHLKSKFGEGYEVHVTFDLKAAAPVQRLASQPPKRRVSVDSVPPASPRFLVHRGSAEYEDINETRMEASPARRRGRVRAALRRVSRRRGATTAEDENAAEMALENIKLQVECLASELAIDFEGTHVVEVFGVHCRLNIPRTSDICLSKIFRVLEGLKDEYGIVDYVVSEASLDSMFIRINTTNQR